MGYPWHYRVPNRYVRLNQDPRSPLPLTQMEMWHDSPKSALSATFFKEAIVGGEGKEGPAVIMARGSMEESLCNLVGNTVALGRVDALSFCPKEPYEWRRRVGEATRPLAYDAPSDGVCYNRDLSLCSG